MLTSSVLSEAIFDTIRRSSCRVSPDVRRAFERAIAVEDSELSCSALSETLRSLDLSAERCSPACPDTGWPLFFFKIGHRACLPGGLLSLTELARDAVRKATRDGVLRATMKHPLTGADPGDNVGMNIPGMTYRFVPGGDLQVTFVAKGGGSECLGGTRYRMIAFADGLAGIRKSIIDWYAAGARTGAICPPAIVGIGIGGTFDIAAELAKQAAVLRIIGSRHPEPDMARLEEELTGAINTLGIGAMGAGGRTSVFAVHVEYALTHIAGIALAMSANCWIARRATTCIHPDGSVEHLDDPGWFEREAADA